MAMWRRVDRIMQELVVWRGQYLELMRNGDTPAIALKAAERAEQVDELWHELSDARECLRWMV